MARALFHTLLILMTRNSGQAYPPTLQMNEEQHVVRNQPSERKHFHREEVGGHQYRHVSTDKVFPTRRLLPLGSRWNIMAAENIAHRLIREPETQVCHGAHDPVIAPPGIFLRHPHHQSLGLLVNSGTTPGFAKLRSVELAADTGASKRYLAGVPLPTLMLQLGHESLAVTQDSLADVRKPAEAKQRWRMHTSTHAAGGNDWQ